MAIDYQVMDFVRSPPILLEERLSSENGRIQNLNSNNSDLNFSGTSLHLKDEIQKLKRALKLDRFGWLSGILQRSA